MNTEYVATGKKFVVTENEIPFATFRLKYHTNEVQLLHVYMRDKFVAVYEFVDRMEIYFLSDTLHDALESIEAEFDQLVEDGLITL